MASQQPPRPFFRFPSMRAPAPPPARAPAPTPAPAPTVARPPAPAAPVARPGFPIRPPTQTQEPEPQPRPAPPPAPAPAPALSRPPVAPPAAPPRSPVAPPAPQPLPRRSPPSLPPSAAPAPRRSPTPPPPQSTKSPPQTASVPKSVANSETINGKPTTPPSSPKVVKPLEKTPTQSPKTKPLSHPPSPLALPPAQIKTDGDRDWERGPMADQKTIDKPMQMPRAHHNGIASNGKKEFAKHDNGLSKKLSDTEEMDMRVITLMGENKGAVMELSPSRKKIYSMGSPMSLHKTRDNHIAGSNGDHQSRKKNGEDEESIQSPMTAFLNSNVQGLNNSIICGSSLKHKDPGIHISLARKANGSLSRNASFSKN